MGAGGVGGRVVCCCARRARGFVQQGAELVLLLGREMRELPDVQGLDAGDGVLSEVMTTLGEVQVIGTTGAPAFDQVLAFEFGELVGDVALGDEEPFSEVLLSQAWVGMDMSKKVELHDGQAMLGERCFDFLEVTVVGAGQERPENQGPSFGAQLMSGGALVLHGLNLNIQIRHDCNCGTDVKALSLELGQAVDERRPARPSSIPLAFI